MKIRPATVEDAAAICEVYAPYVESTAISFEEVVPSVDDMAGRIAHNAAVYGYFVAEVDGVVVGYAYGSQYAVRHAYRFTAEVSVYVSTEGRGKGVGRALYDALIPHMEAQGFHTLISIIALPNDVSAKLHERYGFIRTGTLPEVGYKFDCWHDIGIWTRKGQ